MFMTQCNGEKCLSFSLRVFRDRELHSHLDELVGLTVYRVLHTGVQTQAIPHCNPLDPVLLDTLTGVRWLRLSSDDKVSALKCSVSARVHFLRF